MTKLAVIASKPYLASIGVADTYGTGRPRMRASTSSCSRSCLPIFWHDDGKYDAYTVERVKPNKPEWLALNPNLKVEVLPENGHDLLFLQVDSLSFHLVQISPVR